MVSGSLPVIPPRGGRAAHCFSTAAGLVEFLKNPLLHGGERGRFPAGIPLKCLWVIDGETDICPVAKRLGHNLAKAHPDLTRKFVGIEAAAFRVKIAPEPSLNPARGAVVRAGVPDFH